MQNPSYIHQSCPVLQVAVGTLQGPFLWSCLTLVASPAAEAYIREHAAVLHLCLHDV